ncbi:MAG: hypothetical protein U1F56_02240 [Rubrivivax sp.]
MSQAPFKRPELDVRGPDRSFGHALRSAQAAGSGDGIAGVPLQTVTDAVVATVRLGYRVADREIERGRRVGQRLREGAERAGIADPEQWVQQAERLFGRGVAGGSEWVDAFSKDLVQLLGADPQLLRLLGQDGQLQRLLRAEWRLLARWLGLPLPPDAAASAAPGGAQPAPAGGVQIVLACDDGADRRAVRLLQAQWQELPAEPLPLWFHRRGGSGDDPMTGELSRVDGGDRLVLRTRRTQADGCWRAAVCTVAGRQLGHVDVEL